MAWRKDKTIFAKEIAALILSNINPEQCIEKYEELQSEIFPGIKYWRQREAEEKQKLIEKMRNKVIYISQ